MIYGSSVWIFFEYVIGSCTLIALIGYILYTLYNEKDDDDG